MTEENLEQIAVTEGAETTPGTETKKKTTRKKSSTGTKRATVADVMKRLDTIEKNMAENAALAAESDGKVEDIYFMTSDMSGKIGIIAETPKPVTGDVPAGQEFVTSREQFNTYSKLLNRREGELANQKMLNLMMQMCNMREDFVKLCTEMEKKISKFTAKEVLESFKAYEIDMENMLLDAGVSIGPYGKDGDKIDTLHQRIVGVVATDDAAKNGVIAKRISEGYEYNGRVLVKEKVNVFKKVGGVAKTASEETKD